MIEDGAETQEEILIVEDEQIVALDLRIHLNRLGYAVGGSFTAAEDVITEIRDRDAAGRMPALVLMDIHLQGEMDGVAAARIIREEFRLPVILLTAYADNETLDRAKVSEPFAYIVKPFDDQELRNAVVLALYRNRMERAVRSREALLSGVLASIPSGVLVADPDGTIRYANDRAWEILHHDPTDAIDDHLPQSVQNIARRSDRAVVWSPERYEGGTVEVAVGDLGGAGEAPRLTVWVLHDITDQVEANTAIRQKDAQLAHAQRMEAVGRISGGLAHDFNNLVTVIMGYTRLVLEDLEDQPELSAIRDNVTGILQTARRSVQLTRQLLAFSRVQSTDTEKIDPDGIIGENRSMFEGLLPEFVTLHIDLRATDTRVNLDRPRFEQTVLNLLLNARDATDRGGEIFLTTETVRLTESLATPTHTIGPGTYLVLRVVDTGAGIPTEALPHIFEPFFTTKETQRGSGFGLATVYTVVHEANGAIDVSSTLGKGTSFAIYLPADTAAETVDTGPGEEPTIPAGSGDVLVVLEEDAIRAVVSSVLSSRGYTPILARSVGDGLLTLERHPDVVAVVSDLSAAVLTAGEIVARYRSICDAGVVLVVTTEEVNTGASVTLTKPFEPWELLQAVDAAVGST